MPENPGLADCLRMPCWVRTNLYSHFIRGLFKAEMGPVRGKKTSETCE